MNPSGVDTFVERNGNPNETLILQTYESQMFLRYNLLSVGRITVTKGLACFH